MSNSFLPYGRQWVDDEDIQAVVAVLKGDFLTTGPLVGQFEKALAELNRRFNVKERFFNKCQISPEIIRHLQNNFKDLSASFFL